MPGPTGLQYAHAWLRGLRAAFVFLTRVPLGGHPYEGRELSWAYAHLPLVGAVIGFLSSWAALLAPRDAPTLGAVLIIGASVMLTGAFHEDGLADSADALGGMHSRARVLEIMKDSRIGTYGACSLALVLMFRVACVAYLLPGAWASVTCAHCLARLPPVWLLKTLPYVRDPATSKQPNTSVGWPQVASASCATLAVLSLLLSTGELSVRGVSLSLLAAVVLSWSAASYLLRRVGGVTGDLLGATEQLCECLILLVLVWDES